MHTQMKNIELRAVMARSQPQADLTFRRGCDRGDGSDRGEAVGLLFGPALRPHDGVEVRAKLIGVRLSDELPQAAAIGDRMVFEHGLDLGRGILEDLARPQASMGRWDDAAVGEAVEHGHDVVLLSDHHLGDVADLPLLGAAGFEPAGHVEGVPEVGGEVEGGERLRRERDEPQGEGDPGLDDGALGHLPLPPRRRGVQLGVIRPAIGRRGGRRGGLIFSSGFLSDHDVQYI